MPPRSQKSSRSLDEKRQRHGTSPAKGDSQPASAAAADAAAAENVALQQGFHSRAEKQGFLDWQRKQIDALRQKGFEARWRWSVAFWAWLLVVHFVGLWLFTSGFLLTRLVLEDKSSCALPPIGSDLASRDVDTGCWHPKTFDRAVVVIIDALRYDFTTPARPEDAHAFHNAFPFLYDTALSSPQNAFLRPFIADPPTATLQRLKGLTTGTLPTFVDLGTNFAGTAIDEDNLLLQMRDLGKKIAHLGDDTWWALFPHYFEPNISKAYDSFNVWDLHTVDNGVLDNIFPLLAEESAGDWDLLIGHCLGVDHAGHRYGPDHAAMTAKLQQMDRFVKRLAESVADDTLLVVMGDHGMDSKGDHGGESDDEVEAALWMYSKRPVFGRTSPEHVTPPATAKIRPVNQIDLVPTLALLLGLPIPYNNLGRPIEEAFAGVSGDDWRNLAAVSRMTSAGIQRYQQSYFKARGVAQTSGPASPSALWAKAAAAKNLDMDAYKAFTRFQEETLLVCKGLWARFDIPRMLGGVVVAAAGVVVLLMYSSRRRDEEFVVQTDPELDYAEQRDELMTFRGKLGTHPDQTFHKNLLRSLWDVRVLPIPLAVAAAGVWTGQPVDGTAAVVLITTMAGVAVSLWASGKTLLNLRPTTVWGWLSVVFTASQSIGFASNSFTIWEDSILLFFITTFGAVSAIAAFRIESPVERTMSIFHSLVFVLLGRLASYSKLCREEQMPYCTSTYYASVTSSTSAPWQLALLFIASIAFPSIVKSFMTPTRSWGGLAPVWISYVFRGALFLSAVYWLLDAAGNDGWLADWLPDSALKSAGVYLAQLVLALTVVAGSTAFGWSPPNVTVVSTRTETGQPHVAILGYPNALGARYLLLPLNILAACVLLSKPTGAGTLCLMMWQILSLVEILHLNNIRAETIGPTVLAMLGNFYFFKTGHQAVLSSIQWDSAFIPLFSVRYPWSPLAVLLNTFSGQILAAACVPLVTLWRVGPKQKGVLEATVRALAVFAAYYAVEALATMSWAGHLRRHLMLYRVFSPRFMLAGVLLLVLDLVILLVSLTGARNNSLATSDMFGWVE